jgi:AcrR family transcriptional regulator
MKMKHETARTKSLRATRKKLLEVAEAEFARTDFSASTLEIARAAGVAHGTVFFHFPHRNDLILDVVQDRTARITDRLYQTYKNAEDLRSFLIGHFTTIQDNWSFFKALISAFSQFDNTVQTEIISQLAVMNYYLIEAFHCWSDHELVRTITWQGTLIYLSFLGDYMFDKNNISRNFVRSLIEFFAPAPGKNTAESRVSAGKNKLCSSCGMLLYTLKDHAGEDMNAPYCRYCTDEQGTLKPYRDVLTTMTDFFQRTQVLNKKAAKRAARLALAKNPAWKSHARSPKK